MTAIPPPATHPIDTSKAHPARVYDWYLGGEDHYPVDVELGQQIVSLEPQAKYYARHNRWFMQRATRHLVGQAGIRQFLDIGAGIPTEPNLHRIAQSAAPEARVVYVDNDPTVLAHAEALLRGTPEGATEFLQADAREPDKILEQAEGVLDFSEPVAVSLNALLHFVSDEEGAYDVVNVLVAALAPGSHLVLSQISSDFDPVRTRQAVDMYKAGGVTLVPRARGEVERFFEGLELLEPGIGWLPDWHPELGVDEVRNGTPVSMYAGVARKP
ncbi:SAM-dependent methyltransferase [Streptomyces sp. NPDC059900]|uniref:SAM-dependent methyltransferase n=1 Tax=Streptomyces sp. NPDC059900 TaxID=3155816 RepID=UPI00341A1F05